jgi:hypothetical protein
VEGGGAGLPPSSMVMAEKQDGTRGGRCTEGVSEIRGEE